MQEVIELSPADERVVARCDYGVSSVPRADRVGHSPDCCLVAVRSGSLVARCSCWWRGTPSHDGARTGIIGHYASVDEEAGLAVLSRACELLEAAGCATAVGPMDGTTWRSYRFVVDRGPEPPFFLEPENPQSWPDHWSSAGFSGLASYMSAVTDQLDGEDARGPETRAQLAAAGVSIRAFDRTQPEAELRRIFRLSAVSFSRNLLYSPTSEEEFLEQYRALLPFVHPDLILLAEREGGLVGFIVALPDVLQARRAPAVDTVIVKTVAVDPAASGMGLGGALVAHVHHRARQLGFRRAIHALMHETNVSRRISNRYARTFRRYVLLSRRLTQ